MSQKGNVDVCPVTKDTWVVRAKAKSGDCGGQSVYHCLSDSKGRKWERCVEKSLIKEGFCPIFTNKGFIDWKPCNISIPTCPNISYVSDEVYKYPHCYGNNNLHEQTGKNKADGVPVGAIIGVSVGLFMFAIILVVWFQFFRRKPKNPNSQDEEDGSQEKLLLGKESDEIVKEQSVDTGIALLFKEEERSIVVVGKFGNSVSSTSRRILKKFQERMKWTSLERRYTDLPSSVNEKTIMYIYGWFGLWNDDLCSLNKVKIACKSLIQILNETRNVKLILGMRSDLYKKYHEELDKEFDDQKTSLLHNEIILDSGGDFHNDNEYVRFLNDHIVKPCEKSDCACKRLEYEMLRKGKDRVVGTPLKLRIIEKYHDLIPSYIDHCDILKVMIDHFIALEKDKERRYVYEWIVYICLKGKFAPGSLDKEFVKKIGFEIDEQSFRVASNDKKVSKLGDYIRMRNSDKQSHVSPENAEYVFWHPFIYICAFHFLFHRDPEFVMNHCNVDAILQLVRPKEFKTSYLEVTADDRCVTLFNERIHSSGITKEYANHPLFQVSSEMVTEMAAQAIRLGIGMFNEMQKALHEDIRIELNE